MIFSRIKPRRSPIGIDIGARYIFAVQMDGNAADRCITAAVAFPRINPGHAISASELLPLVPALQRAGFTGNKLALAAPRDRTIGGFLDIPRADGSAHMQMARIELARTHRCAPDSFEMECWTLPHDEKDSTGPQVMTVACRHADATAYLDVFESAGFDVASLDVRACALARSIAPLVGPRHGIAAVLELNWNAASLVLLYRDEVVYERELADADLQRVHDAIVQRLQLDAEMADYLLLEAGPDALSGDAPVPRQTRSILATYLESLSMELRASLAYATQPWPQAAVETLFICGDGAAIPDIDRRLSAALEIPVRKISPADLGNCPPHCLEWAGSSAMTAAFGLSL